MSNPSFPDKTERQRLRDTPVTLDGHPARVCGEYPRVEFPTVQITTGAPCYGVQFCWETVRHVIDNRNGAFKS